jgi:hypothetical protein
MNLNTVRTCAEITARHQLACLGHVNEDVQELLDILAVVPDGELTVVPFETPAEEASLEQVPAEAPVEQVPAEEASLEQVPVKKAKQAKV